MTLNFNQITNILAVCEELKDTKMPFKLSLILAKNISVLKAEQEFYIDREREFAMKYLATDENGQFIQQNENAFKIIEGMEKECMEARMELNNFVSEVALRMIPISLIENMEFTPSQLEVLEILIEEE